MKKKAAAATAKTRIHANLSSVSATALKYRGIPSDPASSSTLSGSKKAARPVNRANTVAPMTSEVTRG
jgi:hypothetical protein